MAGEPRVKLGTQKTLEANGASIASGAVVQANDANYVISTDGGNYPDAEFVLTAAFSVAPTEGSGLSLLARPLNVDGTSDTEVPEVGRPTYYVDTFVVNNVTTSQTMWVFARDVPRDAEYYLYNNGTGQTVSAGWVLKVTPRSYEPTP